MKLCVLCGMDSNAHLDSDGEYHPCEEYAVDLLINSFVEGLERRVLSDEMEAQLRKASQSS